jgi:hypothetical protein
MPKTIEFRHRAHEVSRVEAFIDVRAYSKRTYTCQR